MVAGARLYSVITAHSTHVDRYKRGLSTFSNRPEAADRYSAWATSTSPAENSGVIGSPDASPAVTRAQPCRNAAWAATTP
jgi:hypothetical protein